MADIYIAEDHVDEFLADFPRRIEASLTAIGIQASNYAADKSPVDTGRLRDSMTYEFISRDANNMSIKVGSAVEYAIYQELGTRHFEGHHMIRNAAADHLAEYKRMLVTFLKG